MLQKCNIVVGFAKTDPTCLFSRGRYKDYVTSSLRPHARISAMSVGARQLIYFCGSMRAGRQDVQLYGNLVAALGRWGEVLTPFVADPSITEVDSEYEGGDLAIHERTMGLLQRADVVVAEVTVPSHGVGYEIGRAVAMDKRVLCLYRPQEGKLLSAMIRGMDTGSNFRTMDYSPDQAEQIFTDFLGPPPANAE